MIPIYRAKKIDSDKYVEGYLDIQKSWETKCLSCGSLDTESHNENWSEACRCNNCGKDLDFHNDNWKHGYIGDLEYLIRSNGEYTQIDPTTLAIHFPDMLDSQGNKIFASLSEDGKGGDICYVRDFSYGDLQGVARYEDNYFRIHRKGKAMGISLKCRDIKATGIQQ